MTLAKIVKVDPKAPEEDYIKQAAIILARGGLVIMPTETVYGIAANMLNRKAVDKLYEIKKRPKDKPFSLHIDSKDRIEDFAWDIPPVAYRLMDKFWPGPLTLILKSKHKPSPCAQRLGKNTIGIRMPDNQIALKIIAEANVPVACPSANISGKAAPISFQEAIQDLEGLVDFAVDAGQTRLQVESSVVDLTVEPLRILREAAVKKEEIEAVAGKKTVLFICTGNSCRSVMAKALLEKRLKERNRTDVEVLSRGIMMLGGLGATVATQEVLKKEGIDVAGHRSEGISGSIIKRSDIILVMERMHEKRVLELAPEAKKRVFLLKEFANPVRNNNFNLAKISNGAKITDDNKLDIADPIGQSEEFYAETFRIIKEAIERIAGII